MSAYQQIYSQIFRTSSHMYGEIPPFWTIDIEDDAAVLAWFIQAIEGLKEDHRERTFVQLRNRDFYAALQSPSLGRTGIPRDREGRDITTTSSKVVVNKLYNLTELWVSKLTRFAPAIAVLPANNEYKDRVAADLGKLIIDNIFYQNEVDSLLELIVRGSQIFGEMYVFTEWDKNKGDYKLPAEERREAREILVDENGEAIAGKDGKPLYVQANERVGDVTLNPVYPWFVWEEPKPYYKDVDWCIKQSFAYVDELKAEYPNKAADIKPGSFGGLDISYTALESNEVAVFEIYHRSTKYLDGGRYIKLTPDVVLENRPLGYSHGELPRVRLTKIDVPGEMHGTSLFNNLLLLQVMLNNLYSIAYTNMSLGSHAYWMVPTQANVQKEKIKNSATVLSYTAPYAPKLEVFRTVGAELFSMINDVATQMVEASGHQGLSQGDPPPGVDAAIALGMLEEQENQRANSDIKKYNAFIRKLAKMSLATAQDFYQSDDGRLLRVVGRNGQDRLKALDTAKFAGPYDVKVFRSTALSESKSARLQQLMMIKQNWPNAVSDKRFLEIMELGDDAKFYDIATVAIRAAEAENENLKAGEEVQEPAYYEDHLVHWDTHLQDIQSISFKTDSPPEIKQKVFDHVIVHEMFMFDNAKKSIAYAQKLALLEQYPAFFNLPVPVTQLIMWLQAGMNVDRMLEGLPQIQAMQQAAMMPPAPGGAAPADMGEPMPEGENIATEEEAPPLEEAPPSEDEAAMEDERQNLSGTETGSPVN